MLQQEEFIIRLKKIIEDHQLSASQFADQIQVPRSSISHLLSGRNKPSLEFVLKVVHSYPEVDLNWLLFGKASNKTIVTNSDEAQSLNKSTGSINSTASEAAGIEKIVVFYSNGLFKTYEPS